MRKNRLRTIFVAIIVAAILVVIATVCVILIPSRPCVRIGAIQNLETIQANGTLIASWSQPSAQGDCPMTYRIQLSDGTNVIQEGFSLLRSYHFLNVSFAPCSSSTISVRAVTAMRFGDDVEGKTGTFTHFGSVGPVTNLQVLQGKDALIATWDPPEASELCQLSYEVELQTPEKETHNTSDHAFTFDQFNSRPCSVNTVMVTPLGKVKAKESLRGQEETRVHLGDVGPVEDFWLERMGRNLLANWRAPNDSLNCLLAYEITLTFQGELIERHVTVSHRHNFTIEDTRPCSLSNVTITPIATHSNDGAEARGLEIHRVHIEELGPVVNLEVAQQTELGLLVGWNPPGGSEFCANVSYEVVLQTKDETVLESHVVLENQIVLVEATQEPCVTNVIIVTPKASMNDGETVVEGTAIDVRHFGEVGPVENLVLAQNDDDLMIKWVPPVVKEDCPMVYRVNMWHNEDDLTTDLTDKLECTFENAGLKPCVISEVSIIPIVRKDLYESEGEEARAHDFGEIGPVTNFELTLNDDNQLVARWDAPVESELCDLSYEMLLESTEEVTAKVFGRNDFEYVLGKADLRPCAMNNVTLTPIAFAEGGLKRGLSEIQKYFAGVGPVENLEVSQNGEALSVSWSRPIQSELCQEMSYEVTLTFGEAVLDHIKTDVEGHLFTEVNLQACAENRISVTPIGRREDEEAEGLEVTRNHFADLGPATNLVVTQQNNELLASWNAPKDSELCIDVSYEVTLKSSDEIVLESHVIIENQLLFEDVDLKSCAISIVSVSPIAKMSDGETSVEGEAVDVLHVADVGAVEDLAISRAEDALVVNWKPPADSDDCNLTYEVNLLYDDEVTHTEVVDALEHTFENVDLRPCVVSEVSVIPLVDGYQRRGEERRLRYIGEIGSVTNFELTLDETNQLKALWNAPINSERCELSYELLLEPRGHQIFIETHFEHVFTDADLRPCILNTVTLTPVAMVEGISMRGPDESRRYFRELRPVANLEVTQQTDGLLASWDPPDESEFCIDVSYELILKTGDEIILDSRVVIENEYNFEGASLEPCAISIITVTPMATISDGETTVTGEGVTSSHVADIGAVEDLVITQAGNTMVINWISPTLKADCPVTYEVSLLNDDEVVEIDVTDVLEHTFENAVLRPCVINEVSVTPLIEAYQRRGEEKRERHIGELGSVGKLDVTQQTNILSASWDPPGGSEFCVDISYEVVLKTSDDITVENYVVMGNEYNFEDANLEPCAISMVTVTPSAKASDGETAVRGEGFTKSHVADIAAVENLMIAQAEGTLVINWMPPVVSDDCPLTYEITLLHENEVIETGIADILEHAFENVDLRPCVVSEVSVVPLVDLYQKRGEATRGRHVGEIGSVTNFELTLDETKQLTASWNAPIDSERCELSYEILLEAIADQLFTSETHLEHVFNDADLRPCVLNTVTLTPVAMVEDISIRGPGDSRRYFRELGPVTNLEVTQQTDGLLASWDPPDESEFCIDVSYELILQSGDEIILDSRVVIENEYKFEGASLEPCAISMVTVMPMAKISDGDTGVEGEALTSLRIADIGPVENLVMAQAEGRLAVNWAQPIVAPNCPLSYEVTLWYNGDVSEIVTTDNLGLVFENADMRPCVINEVSVIPIARKDLHEGKGEETRGSHFGEIGLVTNFELALDDGNQLIARWNAPIDSEVCELVYEILLESSEPVPPQIITESHFEHVFSELELQPCVLYTVTVTPKATIDGDLQRGQQDTLTYFADIGPVEGLEVNQNGVYLSVNWARPTQSELCSQVLYEVALTFGELVLDQVQTGAETHTFAQSNLQPCTENHVSVIPIGSNQDQQSRGPVVSQRHFAAVGPVQNLGFQMEPFGISWSKPADSDLCDLTYQILMEPSGETAIVTANFYLLEDIPCHRYTATVTPLVQEAQSGAPQTEAHEIPPADEIGPVRNLRFSQNSFEWDPPLDLGGCEVTYEITLTTNGGESEVFTTKERVLEVSFSCSTVALVITASVGHIISAPTDLEVEIPLLSLGPVENLEFRSDRVRWERPPGPEACPIVYKLKHTRGSEINEVTLPESQTYFLIKLKFCSHHEVSVYAFYEEENITGTTVSIEKTIPLPNDPTAIGRVESLRFVSETRAEWQPPISVDTESCNVVYSVTLDRDFDMSTTSQEGTLFDIPKVHCSKNVLSVFPIVSGVLGQVAEVTSEMEPSYIVDHAPSLISHTKSSNSVRTTWKAYGKEINACPITTFRAELNSAINEIIAVSDNDERIFSFEIADLFPDTEYTMRAEIHVLGFPQGGPLSEPFTFRTDPDAFEAPRTGSTRDRPVSGYIIATRVNSTTTLNRPAGP